MNLQPYNLNSPPPAWTGHSSLSSCRLCRVLALRLLFVYTEGSRCTSPWCLMVSLCQRHSFFFLSLDSQPDTSDLAPESQHSLLSWWWLCCALLGSEMIPAALYFCTKPCKGLLQASVQGPWPILLLSSEGGVSSGCFWANSHQQETWAWLCLVSLWAEGRGDVPPCRQSGLWVGFVVTGMKDEFGCSCSQCLKSVLVSALFHLGQCLQQLSSSDHSLQSVSEDSWNGMEMLLAPDITQSMRTAGYSYFTT